MGTGRPKTNNPDVNFHRAHKIVLTKWEGIDGTLANEIVGRLKDCTPSTNHLWARKEMRAERQGFDPVAKAILTDFYADTRHLMLSERLWRDSGMPKMVEA
jgi:hypothetical protein